MRLESDFRAIRSQRDKRSHLYRDLYPRRSRSTGVIWRISFLENLSLEIEIILRYIPGDLTGISHRSSRYRSRRINRSSIINIKGPSKGSSMAYIWECLQNHPLLDSEFGLEKTILTDRGIDRSLPSWNQVPRFYYKI